MMKRILTKLAGKQIIFEKWSVKTIQKLDECKMITHFEICGWNFLKWIEHLQIFLIVK